MIPSSSGLSDQDDFGIQEFLNNHRDRLRVGVAIADHPATPRTTLPLKLNDHRPSFYDVGPLSITSPANAEYIWVSSRMTAPSSSATPSSAAPSVFDRSPHSGHITVSQGKSSHPPAHPPRDQPSFVQQFAPQYFATPPFTPAPRAASRQSRSHLWCEFAAVGPCPATFTIDDTDSWVEHHLTHLRQVVPRRCRCWFCDHVEFPSPQFPLSDSDSFRLRMEHIRQHIFDEELTVDRMRPDFWMMDHLVDIGYLTREERARMAEYDEVPYNLRIPSSSDSRRPSHKPTSRRDTGELHDLEREARTRRRAEQPPRQRNKLRPQGRV